MDKKYSGTIPYELLESEIQKAIETFNKNTKTPTTGFTDAEIRDMCIKGLVRYKVGLNAYVNPENEWLKPVEPLNVEEWISVKDKPLITFCSGQDYEGKTHKMWQVNEGVPDEFLAALQYNDKKAPNKTFWWIRHCIIQNEIGLCVVGDDDTEPAGWEIEDIQFYKRIKPPKIN